MSLFNRNEDREPRMVPERGQTQALQLGRRRKELANAEEELGSAQTDLAAADERAAREVAATGLANPSGLSAARRTFDGATEKVRLLGAAVVVAEQAVDKITKRNPDREALLEYEGRYFKAMSRLNSALAEAVAAIGDFEIVRLEGKRLLGDAECVRDIPYPSLDGALTKIGAWQSSPTMARWSQ